MHRMHTTAGTGFSRWFSTLLVVGFALAVLPGALNAGADRLAVDAQVRSTVWLDQNENGVRDKSEAGLADVHVSLLGCDGAFLAATRTDSRGVYKFDVPAGCYRIRVASEAGRKFCPAQMGRDTQVDSDVDPATGISSKLEIAAGATLAGIDAGVVNIKHGELGDRVWEDLNADGIQNVGEPGLANVNVALYDCAGKAMVDDQGAARATRTDSSGYFVFQTMQAGCYRLGIEADGEWQFSATNAALESLDSDIDPATSMSSPVDVREQFGHFDLDAGMYRTASVGDWVWFDRDGDGLQNAGEEGVAGIEVLLLTADGVPTGQVMKTDARGYFEFANLQPGDYRVQYVVPAPYRIGKRNQGIDIQLDSDANSLGTTRVIPVRSGGERMDVDLGLFGGEPVDIAIEKLTNGVDADEPTGPIVEAGADVTWEYIVTNTGDADLFEVLVVDDQGVSVTCPSDFLATGATFTCTGSTDDAQAGQYVNNATVCGNDQTDEPQEVCASDASHYFGSVPAILIETLTESFDADSPTGPELPVGGMVTWEYVVTNSGNIELSDVVVTDSEGVTVTCPSTTLAPGVSMTCSATGTVTSGQYMNVGAVTGTPPVGADVSDSDPSHYFGSDPLISLQKTTNGEDADVAPGPTIGVGEPITWEYTISNDGNVVLSSINVTDDQGVVVTCPPLSLPPGGSVTCTGTGVAQSGPYMNIGTACASVGDGEPVCATDPSHYTGAGAMIEIETLTQNVDADDPTGPEVIVGLPVTWDYVVTNTGGVTLTDIVVVDDQGVPVTCPATTLAPGESFTCSANGTSTAGQYANVGSVSAQGNGETVSDSDPSHYFGIFFEISLEKDTIGFDADVAPGPAIPVGDTVIWTYVATNTGNVRLNTILLSDDQGVTVTCPAIEFLDPGESITCTGEGIAQSGQYANIGNVCGFFEEEEVCDTDPSHYFGAGSGLAVEKSTNGEDADTPTGPEITEDDPVTWTYVVTNTGNVTVNNIVVTDDQGVAVDCPADTLAPGASFTCTGEGIATVGQYANIGSATGQPVDENGNPVGDPVAGSDPSHYLGTPIPTGAIGDTVFVDEDRDGIQDPGEPGLPGVTVNLWTDDDGDGTPDTIIATVVTDANGNYLFPDLDPRLDYFVQVEPVPGQPFTLPNVGDDSADSDVDPATGISPPIALTPGETNLTIDAGVIVLTSGASIEKTTNGEDADTPTGPIVSVGDPITWTYTVTNTGELDLVNIVVTDSEGVAVSCPGDTLAPGDTLVCTGSGVATAGQYSNIGTITGQPSDGGTPIGDPITSDDPSHYFGAGGGLTIEKSTNGEDADTPTGPEITEDDPVTWTYVVTNTGNVAVNNIVVTDDQGVAVDCPADTLAAGASFTCTGEGIAIVGQYANIGSATGQPVDDNGNPIGDPVGDTDPSHYLGTPIPTATIGDTVFVDEDRDGIQDAGEPGLPGVTVNLWTDDDGDGTPDTIIATVVTDANGNYLFPDLDPRLDYFVQVVPVPGQPFTLPNVGDDTADSDVDPATGISPLITLTPGETNLTIDAGVIVLTSGASIEKTTNGEDADTPTGPIVSVGDPVTWTYTVTNTGELDLIDIVVTDSEGVAVSCPADTLAPGETLVCTGSGVATAGQYSNIGTITGQPSDGGTPVGDPVTGDDPSHYFGAGAGLTIEKSTNGEDADTPTGPEITEDDPVSWTYVVTNSGNVTVNNIVVTDDQGVAVSCPADSLAPGASFTCTGEGIAVLGQYANIGSATGQPVDDNGNPIGDPVGDTDPSHYLGTPIAPAAIGDTVFVDEDRDGIQDPGEPGLPGVTVNLWTDDDGDGTPDTIIATLVTDANGNYLFTDLDPRLNYFVQVVPVPGQPFTLPNVGDDTADSDVDPATGISPPIALTPGETNLTIDAGVIVLTSGASIEKTTNGEDADTPTGPIVSVGDPITWTYTVTNTGELDLVNIVVTDSEGVAVSCPSDTLAPGETLVCTGTGVATAGQYSNIGTITGQPSDGGTPVGDPITGDDPSHYFGAGAGLTIEKSTNGEDADTPTGPEITEDDPVSWTYVVTNTGNVTVNNIVVTDDQGVAVNCPADSLAAGASFTCTGEGIATVGQYANIGSATGQPVDDNGNPIGDPVGDTDPSHYLGTPIATAAIGDTVFVDEDRDGIQDPGEPGLPGVTVNLWTDDDGDGTPDTIIATLITDANGNYLFTDLDPRLNYFVQVVPVPGQPFTLPNVGDDSADSDVDPATGISPPIALTPGETNLTIDAGVIVLTSGASIEKTTNGEDADTPTGPIVSVGDPITWTYTVTNTGELDLVNIVVTDSEGVAVSCPGDTLAPGETLVCTGTGVATAGQYSNIGTITGQPSDGGTPIGDPITGDDPSHYFGAGGGLTIEKSTNGQDADTPTGPEITEDDPVSWTYVVTNTGNVTVNNIVVTDDQGVAVSCPAASLAPGASFTCTGEGIATVGQYANIGSATGQPVDDNGNPIGDPVGDTDPSHYLGTPIATAAIGDTVFVDEDRDGVQDPGERGVPDRIVNLWVDDDGDGTPDRIIATTTTDGNGNYLFTDLDPRLTYFVQVVPVPGEPFTQPNVGDDAADSDVDPLSGITGPITVAPGETNLTIDAGILKLKPDVTIQKFTNGVDADVPTGPILTVGETVNWTYVVRNPGEFPLIDIVVTDDQGVTVSCPMTTLDVGASMTCTGSGVATAGQYSNLGSVSAQPTDNGTPFGDPRVDSDPSHYFGAGAGLTIEKLTNGEDADTPTGPEITEDQPVMWTYVVTNNGNVTVNNITVTDDQGVSVSCPTDTLAPGATLTCTGEGIATVGQYVNIGSATGQPVDDNGNPIGAPIGDSDPSHYLGVAIATASIGDTVFVDTDRDGMQDAGEPGLPGVTVNLWTDDNNDGVPDTIIATVMTDANGNYLFSDLDPRLTYFVQFGAVPGQPFTTPNVGDDSTDSDADPATGITGPITLNPGQSNLTIDAGVITLNSGVSIEKLTNGEDADTPTGPVVPVGAPITWSYVITNTGELTLSNIVVVDDQGVAVTCPGTTLDAGASFTCSGSGTAVAGQYANIGSVTGQPSDGGTPVGDPVSGSDPSHYFGAGGGLTIEKTTNGEDADTPTGPQIVEGQPVNWQYTVSNTGNVTVSGITVSDNQGVAVNCPADTLAPGATLVCTGSGVAVVGQYMNVGSASGQPVDDNGNPIGDPVGDTDPSHYLGLPLPTASIGDTVFVDSDRDGLQDPNEPGQPGVTVNLWIDTDGDGAPDLIVATTTTDANGNYLFTDLDSRETYFVQFGAVPGLPFTTPDAGDDALDSDPDPTSGITPAIVLQPGESNNTIDAGLIRLKGEVDIEKLTNGEDADTPTGPILTAGDAVNWEYIVSNTGELTLTGIVVTDNQGVAVTCPADTLAPGASFVCTGSGTAIAGQYANIGSLTGQPIDGGVPIGNPVSDSDASHYFGEASCVDGNVADHFNQVSYDNNDGSMNWNGPWVENDPQGGGASSGSVSIVDGRLQLNDRPDSHQAPSIARGVDLTGFEAAMLMFDWSTTSAATKNDEAVVEVSTDGGITFTTLAMFESVQGQVVGASEMFDLTPYISANTIIRFRITNLFGGSHDEFFVDNVSIDKKCTAPVCVAGDVADQFNRVRYDNNDGSMDWAGPWLEHDPQGGGASDGAIRVADGVLILTDYPNSHQKPSIRRQVDLSGYPAAMLMFDWTTSNEVDPDDEVTLKISDNGGQSFTVLDVFSGYHGAASGFETYDISPYISGETVIKFVVTNKFGGRWDKFMIDNVRIDKKCDSDDCVVTSAANHGLWFQNLDGNGGADRFDFLPGARFTRNADGTARLTGVARKRTDADESFDVDLMLSGRTTTPPPGSPKNNFGADISDWVYYPNWSGTLLGLDDYAGASLSVTRRGPSFQVGTGANDTQDDVNVFGGSGWFDYVTERQGDRCLNLGRDCVEHTGKGDFNVRIDCADDGGQACVANETQYQALFLPNFNNDGILDRYDLDDGAQFVTLGDGTARLTGMAFKQDEPNYRFNVDLMLSGRTDVPPPGSPYNPQGADPADWVYYPNWSGTLTGEAWNTGALLNIERTGASFQVGTGANAHPNEQSIFGGSGWFDFETVDQPNDCHYYGDCIAHSGHGDVNIQLMCPNP